MPKHVRAVNPANSVTRALDARRGIASQADYQETKNAVQRLGGLGDNPDPTRAADDFHVPGILTVDQSIYVDWNLLSTNTQELLIRGLSPGLSADFFRFYYDGTTGVSGFQIFDPLGSGVPMFEVDGLNGTFDFRGLAGIRLQSQDGLTTNAEIDSSGNITTTGTINGPIDQSWRSGAHHDPGATTLSAMGMTAWTVPATTASHDSVTGSYLRFTTGAVSGNTSGPNGPLSYRPEWIINCNFHVKIIDTANVRLWIGLFAADPSGSAAPLSCAGFRFDTGVPDSFWMCRTSDAAAGASVSSAVPITPGEFALRMLITTTSVKFYINEVLVVTKTTNLPPASSLLAPYARVTTLTAAAKELSFGYFNCLSQ